MRVTDYELFAVPPRWQFLKLELPDGPGLGVEIDEDRVWKRAETNLGFNRSPGHRADGSIGER